MLSIEHPQAVVAGRPKPKVEPTAARFDDRPRSTDRDAGESTGLHRDDDCAWDTRLVGNVLLAPAPSRADCAEDGAGLTIVHPERMAMATHLRITAEP